MERTIGCRATATVLNDAVNVRHVVGVGLRNTTQTSRNVRTIDHNRGASSSQIKFKKMRLLLQHLVGYKTEGNKFKDEEITRYDQIHFYDNYLETLKVTKEMNNLLEHIISRTDDGLRSVIKENVIEFKPVLWVHKVNENEMNKRTSEKVILNIYKIVKTFENFNPYF